MLNFSKSIPTQQELRSVFPEATFKRDDTAAVKIANSIFKAIAKPQKIDIQGTPFQRAVWSALQNIPFGTTLSYSELAQKAGYPKAHRAVGTAVGKNPIAFIIPCHRIIRADGSTGNYRWGSDIKQRILEWERTSSLK